jgi:putative ABC transport system substrate-binding protein
LVDQITEDIALDSPRILSGLASYGISFSNQWRRAAVFVDKILKGANPGDLPVEQPTRFEFVINMSTASALGLAIPSALPLRADEVIE